MQAVTTSPTNDQSELEADTKGPAEADATLQVAPESEPTADNEESCLVQIYPADVVDGMRLIDRETLTIGRDPSADLVLADTSVSRHHASLSRGSDGFRLRDLGSTNGTLINGDAVDDQPLMPGDTIRIGSFIFKFLSAGCVETHYHETVYSALTRDALTGTFNKRYLLESMEREIARARRQKHPLCVVMLDIDHFKSVNDTHGHLVGDEVLREFGNRVGNQCRRDDLLARYGGEEFCLLFNATDRSEALAMTERCREAICREPFETSIGPLPITASFGVTCVTPGEDDTKVEPILADADKRLYEAKRSGRNRVCG